jgi:hypothetical protein
MKQMSKLHTYRLASRKLQHYDLIVGCRSNANRLYTITVYSSSTPTCSLRYAKLLTGYGGSSLNHCLFINLFFSEVQHLNLFS